MGTGHSGGRSRRAAAAGSEPGEDGVGVDSVQAGGDIRVSSAEGVGVVKRYQSDGLRRVKVA